MDFGMGKVLDININDEMKNSYIDYAMSVIVMRALPDVRDGLKPVHRRILYAMHEAGMASNKPHKKSARIVGDVLGKYHPHGDSSVYGSIVRMAQDFSTRYLLVDGHGNFGSVDGDSAAAMRYTEVRMGKISEQMLLDIEKETVDFMPNYDESLKEPTVLPSKIPNLLVNGSSGIAVGMATNIPPHNLGEVVDGLVALIDDKETTIDDLVQIIKGPDFPTAASVLGKEGIYSAYKTGRGVVKMRAKANIEKMANGKNRILVTEIPYQVNKSRLIENIAHLANEKIVDGITDLRDESDRKGMRIVIELRRDVNANVILNQLYKHTSLQDSFGIIMLALVKGRPQVLNLKEILQLYLEHQKEVLIRRSNFDLRKAKDRNHILEGLKIALNDIEVVIKIVRAASNAENAKTELVEKLGLSEKQAQSILEMRLQRLTGLERQKIDEEHKNVLENIRYLENLLTDEKQIMETIKADLIEVKRRFGDERKTTIEIDTSNIQEEDLIAEEDIVITITHGGNIKSLPMDTYRNQKRGGRGVTGMGTKEEDFVEHLFITTTHHNILIFTDKGKVYRLKGYEIPTSGRTAKGTSVVNLLSLSPEEKINAVIPIKEFNKDNYLFMATNLGTVKKTSLMEFNNVFNAGKIAIKLLDEEELIGVRLTDGGSSIIMATYRGLAIHFSEKDVRTVGRVARGVRGIRLSKDDSVVAMDVVTDDSHVLTISEYGMGKRTLASQYRKIARGGKGIINLKVSERTGNVAGVKIVKPDQEIILITQQGIVIRTDVDSISVIGRSAQGVKVIRVSEDDKVVSIAVTAKKIEE